MNSSFGHAAFAALLLISSSPVFSSNEIGYYADENQEEPIDVVEKNTVCPTDRPLRRRGMCRMHNRDETECMKIECCDTHVFISGRCISKDVDPCSLGMCEQACEVKDSRFWCKCHSGFQFHPTNYKNKVQPYCVDVNECLKNNGGCDMVCLNDPGGYHCECEDPFKITDDGRTCLPPLVPVVEPVPLPLIRAKQEPKCYSSCDTVSKLSNQITYHKHRIHALEKKLEQLMKITYRMKFGGSFPDGTTMNRVLDSTAPLIGGFCRCERGPRGPIGPPGMAGPRGEPGEPGPTGEAYSFENMAAVLADVYEEIENLKKTVFSSRTSDPLDLKKGDTLSNHKTGANPESTADTIDSNADSLETATNDPNPEAAEISILDGEMPDNSSSYDFFLKHLRLLAISTSQDDGEDNSYEYEGTEY